MFPMRKGSVSVPSYEYKGANGPTDYRVPRYKDGQQTWRNFKDRKIRQPKGVRFLLSLNTFR